MLKLVPPDVYRNYVILKGIEEGKGKNGKLKLIKEVGVGRRALATAIRAGLMRTQNELRHKTENPTKVCYLTDEGERYLRQVEKEYGLTND